jgi:hypothetical protein
MRLRQYIVIPSCNRVKKEKEKICVQLQFAGAAVKESN